jgi:hypothetical protein
MDNDNNYDTTKSVEGERREEQATLQAQKGRLLARLAELKVAGCTIEYEGSDASVVISFPACFDAARQPLDLPQKDAELVEEFVSECLSAHQNGWEINEGSFGEATISVAEGTVEFNHLAREMIYHDDGFEV